MQLIETGRKGFQDAKYAWHHLLARAPAVTPVVYKQSGLALASPVLLQTMNYSAVEGRLKGLAPYVYVLLRALRT